MDLIYPEHKHPHTINKTSPNEYRIWVCEDCGHIFFDDEARGFDVSVWGHPCKQDCKKKQRCESHLEPYLPELGGTEEHHE